MVEEGGREGGEKKSLLILGQAPGFVRRSKHPKKFSFFLFSTEYESFLLWTFQAIDDSHWGEKTTNPPSKLPERRKMVCKPCHATNKNNRLEGMCLSKNWVFSFFLVKQTEISEQGINPCDAAASVSFL
jgi:hypothetical protein